MYIRQKELDMYVLFSFLIVMFLENLLFFGLSSFGGLWLRCWLGCWEDGTRSESTFAVFKAGVPVFAVVAFFVPSLLVKVL